MKFSLQNVPVQKLTGDNLARSKRSDVFRTALIQSIKQYGVLQPVLVQKKGDTLRLIAGWGRVDACAQNGITEVPAQVFEGDMPDIDLLILAANENNVRSSVPFLDQADQLETVIRAKGCTETEAGKLLGMAQSVTSKISSANTKLAEDVKLKLSEAGIGYTVAYLLSRVEPEKQRELTRMMLANKWTRAQLEKAMKSEPVRAFSFGKVIKVNVSFPRSAQHEEIRETLKTLLNELIKWEKQNVPVDLLSRVLL